MAVSPVIVENGITELKLTATKAKSLAVRTMTNGTPKSGKLPTTGTHSELAEQLNEDTKQRYVKGGSKDTARLKGC